MWDIRNIWIHESSLESCLARVGHSNLLHLGQLSQLARRPHCPRILAPSHPDRILVTWEDLRPPPPPAGLGGVGGRDDGPRGVRDRRVGGKQALTNDYLSTRKLKCDNICGRFI